jgi:hypothetical protein
MTQAYKTQLLSRSISSLLSNALKKVKNFSQNSSHAVQVNCVMSWISKLFQTYDHGFARGDKRA